MNSDQIEGGIRDMAGKVQSAVGDGLGDARHSVEGRARQAAGKMQSGYGAASEQVRGLAGEVADRVQDSPLLAVLAATGIGYLLGRFATR